MKRSKRGRKIVFIALAVVTLCMCTQYIRQYRVVMDLNEQIASMKEDINLEQSKNIDLKNMETYYASNNYIQDQARRKFGLVSDDEILFVIEE